MTINIEELKQVVEQYLSTRRMSDTNQRYDTSFGFARQELYEFIEYIEPKHSAAEVEALKARIADLEKKLESTI
jgi:hypothetical protein